jgi:hypothetical protein
MRRSLLAALTFPLVLAAPAVASDHRMQVSEVFPSATASEQFVELRDPAVEPFPFPPYRLRLYQGDGTPFDPDRSQTFSHPPPFAGSTDPFTYRTGGPNALTVTLPTDTAQVCFESAAGGGTRRIHCIGYGSVTTPVKFGMPVTAAPAAGQSIQVQSCGRVAAAAPTPDAANTETGICSGGGSPPPGGGGTGGGPGGGGGTDDATDLTPPQQRVSGRRRQDVDRLAVGVTLSEAGRVTVRARVNVPDAARLLRFRPVTRSVGANTPVRIRLRLARKPRRTVKAALHDGRRLRARITIAARDVSGNVSTARRAIRLTD